MSKGKPKPVAQQTVTQETALPAWLQPAVQQGVQGAQSLYQQGAPEMYPGQMTAPFSSQTQGALDMLESNARSGAGTQGALDTYNATVGGDYLFGGDGFNAAFQAASNRIIPQVQSMYSRAGRSGSGLAQTAMTQALGDSFAGLYNAERGRQQGALGMAPQMAGLSALPGQQLAGVGGVYDAQAQAQLDEDIARYQYENGGAEAMNLDQYLSRLGGVAPYAGGTSAQNTPIYQNKTNNLLGTALGVGGLLFGGAPFGATGTGLLGLFK